MSELNIESLSKMIEELAEDAFDRFRLDNPIVNEVIVNAKIRDSVLHGVFQTLWKKGYACGFCDVLRNHPLKSP